MRNNMAESSSRVLETKHVLAKNSWGKMHEFKGSFEALEKFKLSRKYT